MISLLLLLVVSLAERSEAVVVVVNASSSDSEDELCLYCGRCCSQPIMYFAALVLSLFNDGARANLSFYFAALILSVFATRPQGEELRL